MLDTGNTSLGSALIGAGLGSAYAGGLFSGCGSVDWDRYVKGMAVGFVAGWIAGYVGVSAGPWAGAGTMGVMRAAALAGIYGDVAWQFGGNVVGLQQGYNPAQTIEAAAWSALTAGALHTFGQWRPRGDAPLRAAGVGGNGAASELSSLNGLSRTQAVEALEQAGFRSTRTGPTAGGWQTFRHADGSQVDLGPGGRVVRTAAPRYGPDGSRINSGQRLASDGSEIPRSLPHDQHPPETLSGQ
jgi:hypothetical protein